MEGGEGVIGIGYWELAGGVPANLRESTRMGIGKGGEWPQISQMAQIWEKHQGPSFSIQLNFERSH